jgi:hypothetical protein
MLAKNRLYRLSWLSGAILTALVIAQPAQACSDLPNICAQRQEHHDLMNRLGREYSNAQQGSSGSYVGQSSRPQSRPRRDFLKDRLKTATQKLKSLEQEIAQKPERLKEPKVQAALNGTWEFFQSEEGAAPGEYCTAFFSSRDGFVSLLAQGGGSNEALMTFFSKDIPRPDGLRRIDVSYTEDNEAPRKLEQVPTHAMTSETDAGISLFIRDVDTFLERMKDAQSFDLAIADKSVAKVKWQGGLAARDKWRDCVNAGPKRPKIAPSQAEIKSALVERLQKLAGDPKYQDYLNGSWRVFQGQPNAAPGESCLAMFAKQQGVVVVAVPGKKGPGVFLTFIGADIPRPRQPETIQVTLNQPNHPPQTVKAFNYVQPGFESGAITLTVPTIEVALAGWQDVQEFDLAIAGKSVSKIEWHSGLAAKQKLSACVSARSAK